MSTIENSNYKYSPHSIRLGEPQKCPICGRSNPSGRKLPDECISCDLKYEPKSHIKGFDNANLKKAKKLIEMLQEDED